jgi:hypothetical protein
LTLTENSVLPGVAVPLASQSLTLYQTAVTPSAATTLALNNLDLGLSLTLNGLRKFWLPIETNQVPSTPYDDCSIASTPICYTPPAPSTTPNPQGQWVDISFSSEVFGDDFAIASQPICGSPYPLPPIGKYPPAVWGSIGTSQTANWIDIST